MAVVNALNERNISRFLFNPFAVYVADVGSDQPTVPSFFTENAMTFTFNKTFVPANAYSACSGILYIVRQDLQSFDFRAAFQIKETTIKTLKLAHGGTESSDGNTLTVDAAVSNRAFWFESCYNDDGKILRITIPQGKNAESSEFSTGDTHAVQPVNVQALPDLTDTTTLPTIYIEP